MLKYFYVDPSAAECVYAYRLVRTGEIAFQVTKETLNGEDKGYLTLVNHIHFLDCEWTELIDIAGSYK